MNLITELHHDQQKRWPSAGRHILAQFDTETIIVYQAYHPAIAGFAVKHGRFGDGFSYRRMSWIKPNFLWMMYRSGWGTKENQQTTLALRLRRPFFDRILRLAVPSSWLPGDRYPSEAEWKGAVARSNVRLQWDPDHGPSGNALARRAIQLGLRGPELEEFGTGQLLEVMDISEFVTEQKRKLDGGRAEDLETPQEWIYLPDDSDLRGQLGLDRASEIAP